MSTTATQTESAARSQLRVLRGEVTSAKTAKTIKVTIEYKTRHPKYGKYLKRSTVYTVHDEKSECREGDIIEFAECRPMSRTKHHRLVKVVEKAPEKLSHDTGDDVTHASGKKVEEKVESTQVETKQVEKKTKKK